MRRVNPAPEQKVLDQAPSPSKESKMKILHSLAPFFLLATGVATAQESPPAAIVEEEMIKPLPDFPGKEALVLTVIYPPGAVDPVHRHDAHAFVYVLEGSIVMGVRGGKTVTLTPGQSFYEGPEDVHTVGRNASTTKPAKFVVVLLKNRGSPVATLAK